MFIEMAIGDAYGVGFEFVGKEFVQQNNTLQRYYPHEKYSSLYKMYSDDTQMAIGIVELIMEQSEWTKENVAEKLLSVYKRDERQGYSSRMENALKNSGDGLDFLNTVNNKSESNGATVRSFFIGYYYPTLDDVLGKSALNASITHNTLKGIKSAQAAALIAYYFRYEKGEKSNLGKYIDLILKDSIFDTRWQKPVGQDGIETIIAVISLLKEFDKMSHILKEAINLTGDVDTVAALSLAAATLSIEIENDLPMWLYDELENGFYGKDFLINLDKQFPSASKSSVFDAI